MLATSTVSNLYMGGKIVAGFLERDLILKSTSMTTGKIINLLSGFIYGGEKHVEDTIMRLDIRHKLEVIESYLKTMPDKISRSKRRHSSNAMLIQDNNTLLIAMQGVSEMIDRIHVCLDNIQRKIIEHNDKYVSWLYGANVMGELSNLERCVHNLDNRFKLFMAIK